MRSLKILAAVSLLSVTGPAVAKAPEAVTVKDYPLNLETGGSSGPITLYRQQGGLAFVVIDSIDARDAYQIQVGSIAHYGSSAKTPLPLGAYLPLRDGEAVILQLAQNSTLKLRAHVMVVTGYRA